MSQRSVALTTREAEALGADELKNLEFTASGGKGCSSFVPAVRKNARVSEVSFSTRLTDAGPLQGGGLSRSGPKLWRYKSEGGNYSSKGGFFRQAVLGNSSISLVLWEAWEFLSD